MALGKSPKVAALAETSVFHFTTQQFLLVGVHFFLLLDAFSLRYATERDVN